MNIQTAFSFNNINNAYKESKIAFLVYHFTSIVTTVRSCLCFFGFMRIVSIIVCFVLYNSCSKNKKFDSFNGSIYSD